MKNIIILLAWLIVLYGGISVADVIITEKEQLCRLVKGNYNYRTDDCVDTMGISIWFDPEAVNQRDYRDSLYDKVYNKIEDKYSKLCTSKGYEVQYRAGSPVCMGDISTETKLLEEQQELEIKELDKFFDDNLASCISRGYKIKSLGDFRYCSDNKTYIKSGTNKGWIMILSVGSIVLGLGLLGYTYYTRPNKLG